MLTGARLFQGEDMSEASHLGRPTGRRKRRIARRKTEILDAAARIFAEKGYANTTTKEIAEAADMAEGTLYNYFGGKRDLLLAVAHETRAAIEAMFEDAQQRQIQERRDIVALVAKGYDLLLSSLPFIRTLLAEAWLDDAILQTYVMERLLVVGQYISQFVQERVDSGVFRPIDPDLATRMILGMYIAPILPVLRGVTPPPSREELHALAESVVDLLWDGIRIRQEGSGEGGC
jgi:AcrR family transcriptional regulator